MPLRNIAALVGASVLLSACNAGAAPEEVAAEAARKLGDIRSARMALDVSITGTERAEGEEVGFSVDGVFQLPDEEGELPYADLDYVALAEDEVERGFVSTPDGAWVEIDGETYELPPERAAPLTGSIAGETSIFEELDVDSWLLDPEETDAGDGLVGVTSDLDVVAAFNDILQIAAGTGTTVQAIEGDDAEQLEAATRSATLELHADEEDRLVRYLHVEIELGLDEAGDAVEVLGPFAGARFDLELRLDDVNEDVEVTPPPDALPFEEFTG